MAIGLLTVYDAVARYKELSNVKYFQKVVALDQHSSKIISKPSTRGQKKFTTVPEKNGKLDENASKINENHCQTDLKLSSIKLRKRQHLAVL